MEGKLIVIEGIDGSGKGTQVNALIKNIPLLYHIPTASFSFPQYEKNFFGRLVGRMLAREFGDISAISAYLVSPLYAFDRWETAPAIRKELADGRLVILDRYVPSNLHQAAKIPRGLERKKFIEFFETMEYVTLGLPKEDMVIFLKVRPEIAQELARKKAGRVYLSGMPGELDSAEANLAHLREASEVYEGVAQNKSHWVVVDCMEREDKILGEAGIQHEILNVLRRQKILPD